MRRAHASVLGLARQLGTSWKTVWRAIKPLLEAMDADPARFDGVEILGVDEHIWHHASIKERGPKELTGMVKLTRDEKGRTRASYWTWSLDDPGRCTGTGWTNVVQRSGPG